MKIAFVKLLTFTSGFALALAASTWLPATARAADPIKGAQKLTELNRPAAPTKATATTVAMSCAECVDIATARIDREAKGGAVLNAHGKPTKFAAKHLCDACETTIAVVGHGKAKKDVVLHTCTRSTSGSRAGCAASPQ